MWQMPVRCSHPFLNPVPKIKQNIRLALMIRLVFLKSPIHSAPITKHKRVKFHVVKLNTFQNIVSFHRSWILGKDSYILESTNN